MSVESSEMKKHITLSPLIADFLYAIDKVKKLDGVVKVNLFPTSGKDCLNIYVTVKEESVDLNDRIFKQFIDWQEDYLEFLETHILTENESAYIPKGAYSL